MPALEESKLGTASIVNNLISLNKALLPGVDQSPQNLLRLLEPDAFQRVFAIDFNKYKEAATGTINSKQSCPERLMFRNPHHFKPVQPIITGHLP